MKLKTYQAWTMAEALAFVKTDLGADAVILHTRTFERGGFFGIGRKSVVEITAARAKDMPMPQKDLPKRPEPRAAVRGPAQSERSASPERSATSERAGDVLRASAAARAYGAQPSGGMGGGTGAVPAATPAVAVNKPLDMDSEREKTRRLAQAMAVQLEKQAMERATATRNEDVVREVAIRGAQSAAAAAASSAASNSAAPNNGPAQRFVLVPEPSESGGATRLTAAVVRVPEPTPSISPTHSSLELAQSDAGKPAARATTPSDGELDAISAFVGRVLQRGGADAAAGPASNPVSPPGSIPVREVVEIRAVAAKPARARSLETAYAKLIEQEVAEELATRVLADIGAQFESQIEAGVEPSQDDLRIAIERRLAAMLPSDEGDAFEVLSGRNGARRIAFVGPTGVGKTTTLAKLAAHLKLKRGLRVGIVAADTYRIAAVDQLRTYAEILGLPVEIAASPKDAARACERLSDVDVILIDTAGRSQNDHMKLSELRAFLASAKPDETHLVLSATASARTLAREAEAFGAVGVDRIALTKLDEAATFGTLVTLVEKLGKRVSFFTNGQEVPDHIESARSRRLAALVLGSEVR